MAAVLTLPDYEHLAETSGLINPSELHGMLCGMLCLDSSLTDQQWLAHMHEELPDQLLQDLDSMRTLFKATEQQINSDDFDFALLLPDDDMNIDIRAESLGCWCQGFIAGLGMAGWQNGAVQRGQMPAEVKEFLADVSEISNVGLDGGRASEEDEAAYAEIVEYLRVGVMLVNQHLVAPQSRPMPTPMSTSAIQTLH